MGYNSHITHDLNLSHHHSFNNAKPNSSTFIPNPPYADASPCPTLALSHLDLVLATTEASDKAEEMNELQVLGSSRWNPTAEQLLALEELYRRGTRTPSVAQIQQIANRLKRFGKIEGKNVFYWFQNHKARERQKRRRQLLETPPPAYHTGSLDKMEPGSVTLDSEIQHTNNKCSSNFTKLSVSQELISPAAEAIIKLKDYWTEIEETKKFQHRNISSLNPTWQSMNLVSYSAKDLKSQNLINNFMKPHHQETNFTTLEDENREEQTLELFPLESNYDCINSMSKLKDRRVAIRAINTSFNPHPNQYFEFLPLKNN